LTPEEIVDHLLRTAQWTATRSSGPGGQHRDKASTRAELTVTSESLDGLEPDVAATLEEGLGLNERPLRIVVQDERWLGRNQEIAVERLHNLVTDVLSPRPPRRPTRPPRASRERRLADKVHRATAKSLRRPPDDPE
jgi:ribosome-associated protein